MSLPGQNEQQNIQAIVFSMHNNITSQEKNVLNIFEPISISDTLP